MLFSKSTILDKEWIDVIFAGRNKEYGAYELRQMSSKATNIAVLIVTVLVGGMSTLSFISNKSEPITQSSNHALVDVFLEDEVHKMKEEPLPPKEEKIESSAQVAQDISAKDLLKFTEIKPTSSNNANEDLASIDEALDKKVVLSKITMNGVKGGEFVPTGTFGKDKKKGSAIGRSIGDPNGSSESSEPFISVEVMPMPPGGMSAFVKWVAENYSFPQSAIENYASGLIQVSFIVEKDGSLSSFNVIKDMGYGTGDAAIKLLKRAKKWSPGIQNGREVRVSYSLPIRLSTIPQ